MKYFVGQWLIATQKAVNNAPSARTLGKAYPITNLGTSTMYVKNNGEGSGIFQRSDIPKYFTVQSHELWI